MEQFKNVLPEDFTGVFYFTNYSDEDFAGKWGGKAYNYPAMKTTPMVIYDATPLEIQNIRKKFAKEFAEREFFKSAQGIRLESAEKNPDGSARFNSFQQASQYSDSDLKVFIQKCLEPLPLAEQSVTPLPKEDIESVLSRDEDGELRTQVVKQRAGLKLKDSGGKVV